jgi:hypothetical protein
MPYSLSASDGSINITIADGTVNTTATALYLPGPNALGYGQYVDENLLFLLTNFASNSTPVGTNVQGQLWFNKSTQTLNVYTTSGYTPVSGVKISNTQPANVLPGTIWFNTATEQLFLYNNGSFNLIGPTYTGAQGVSGAIPVQVNDANIIGNTHNIIQLQYGSQVIAIFSSSAAFVPSPAIPGFPTIYSGLTINNSVFSNTGQFYSNANAAAYLPTDPTIQGIQSAINIVTSNVTAVSTAANASINAANVALTSYINSISSSITNQLNSAVTNLEIQANVIVASATASLNNTINNVEDFANVTLAKIVSAETNLSAFSSITASTFASMQNSISTLQSKVYTNTSVAAYLPTYGGAISVSSISGLTNPPVTDNGTRAATTAFVRSIVPSGIIVMWTGSPTNVPPGWAMCNGSNGTPDLRDQFIIGAGKSYSAGTQGGSASSTLSGLPAHTHSVAVSGTTDGGGAHTHIVSINDPGHNHGYIDPKLPTLGSTSYQNGGQGSTWRAENIASSITDNAATGITATTATSPTHTHTISLAGTTGSTGSGSPTVNTIPPYYALCYIMKT